MLQCPQSLTIGSGFFYIVLDSPGGSAVKNSTAMQEPQEPPEPWVRALDREDILEKEMATHSCSCLENPKDRGAWRAAVRGVTESQHDCSDLAQTVCSNRDPNRVRSALHWTHVSLLIYMFLLSLPYNIFVNKFGCLSCNISDLADFTSVVSLKMFPGTLFC